MSRALLVLMLAAVLVVIGLGLVVGAEPETVSPEEFVRPGLEGVYTEMRREPPVADATRTSRLEQRRPYSVDDRYKGQNIHLDPSRFDLRQIVIKFHDGAPVRLRGAALRTTTEAVAVATRDRLARAGVSLRDLQRDLVTLGQILQKAGATVRRAVSSVDEIDLERLRLRAERKTGAEHADLNLFYLVLLSEISTEESRATLLSLRSLPSVEVAYFRPIAFNAQDRPPPTNVDIAAAQGYLRPAAMGGIDVDYARGLPGGRGEDVRIADIERGWDDTHEDLPDLDFRLGINGKDRDDRNHGTAVLGQIVAQDNGFGATGVAPNATIGWSSGWAREPGSAEVNYSVANAVLWAGLVLRAGDIVLIEQQLASQSAIPTCPAINPCGCKQWGLDAVETSALEHAAIRSLTAVGIIVVEAAGNGQTMVRPASTEDSRAIIVGASNVNLDENGVVNTLAPACFTNYGPRVDVQAWGYHVGTLGYGDDPTLRPDVEQWYTRRFGGTSGASPIVVGAVALIQSTRSAMGLPRLDPIAMRTLLVSTGTPQAAGSTPHIGPMPNLRAAIQSYKPEAATTVR
jgi:serine protease